MRADDSSEASTRVLHRVASALVATALAFSVAPVSPATPTGGSGGGESELPDWDCYYRTFYLYWASERRPGDRDRFARDSYTVAERIASFLASNLVAVGFQRVGDPADAYWIVESRGRLSADDTDFYIENVSVYSIAPGPAIRAARQAPRPEAFWSIKEAQELDRLDAETPWIAPTGFRISVQEPALMRSTAVTSRDIASLLGDHVREKCDALVARGETGLDPAEAARVELVSEMERVRRQRALMSRRLELEVE